MEVISTRYESKKALESDIAEYMQALEAHKLTEGVPAPFPPNDLVANIVAHGGEFEWVVEEPDGSVQSTIEEQRQARYRAEADPIYLKIVEESLRNKTEPDFTEWLAKKDAIRKELPYPE